MTKQHGATLIELTLFMVMLSVALTSILLLMDTLERNSVDPLIHKQSLAIAESLLEEIELQNFANPTGGFTGSAIQANRASFDDVMDYNGFSTTGIYSADGSSTAITGLTGYNVSVNAGYLVGGLGTVPASDVIQINVTVTAPNGESLTLQGYRVNY